MLVYIINGKLVSVIMEEDYGDDISGKYLRDLTRFAQYVISESDEDLSILGWSLIKNRHNGESLKFMSFYDAFEYVQSIDPEVQRHKGFINLETDKQISDFLKGVSPLWATLDK